MENELMTQSKKHFSKIGLMYFLGTLIIFGIQIACSKIASAINPNLMTENYNLYFLIIMLPMYAISMPLTILLISRIPAATIEKKNMTVKQWFVAFFMCYSIVYLSNIIGNVLTTVISTIKGSAVSNVMLDLSTTLSPWASIPVMVILAPIMEELIFRKLLIDRTVKFGEGTAILMSGLMFGLFHGNLNQFAYAFTLGIFFGFLYVKTGKILYTVILHMVINFFGSVVAPLLLNYSGYMEIAGAMEDPELMMSIVMEHLPGLMLFMVYALVLLGIVIAGIVLLIANAKKFKTNSGEVTLPKGKRFSTIFLNVGMILFSLFWIVQIISQLFQ